VALSGYCKSDTLRTLEAYDASAIWVHGKGSGQKRQCTAQLSIFTDGEPRVKPLLIFRGQGKRISLKETLQCDSRVKVHFQPNAWCDQSVMDIWVKNCCKHPDNEESLLVMDDQKRDEILDLLKKECDTAAILVLAGCTHIIQPLDAV
jgi:hypothetical protein